MAPHAASEMSQHALPPPSPSINPWALQSAVFDRIITSRVLRRPVPVRSINLSWANEQLGARGSRIPSSRQFIDTHTTVYCVCADAHALTRALSPDQPYGCTLCICMTPMCSSFVSFRCVPKYHADRRPGYSIPTTSGSTRLHPQTVKGTSGPFVTRPYNVHTAFALPCSAPGAKPSPRLREGRPPTAAKHQCGRDSSFRKTLTPPNIPCF